MTATSSLRTHHNTRPPSRQIASTRYEPRRSTLEPLEPISPSKTMPGRTTTPHVGIGQFRRPISRVFHEAARARRCRLHQQCSTRSQHIDTAFVHHDRSWARFLPAVAPPQILRLLDRHQPRGRWRHHLRSVCP
jgi:hypothetical protein